jgi:putative peptidoglycan lipid II flippase
MSGRALIAFAVGLPGFILVKVLAPGFYARQDTKTPVKAATISVIANVVFAVLLVTPLAHVGLALAIALGGWVNAGLLYVWLRHQGIYHPGRGWAKFYLQVLLSTAALAALLWWGVPDAKVWAVSRAMQRVETLAFWVGAGIAVYFLSVLAVGLRPRHLVLREAKV